MKRLILVFATDQGKTLRMTLPYPKDGLTGETVSAAMGDIISSGVLKGTTGVPTSIAAAYIQDTTRTDLI